MGLPVRTAVNVFRTERSVIVIVRVDAKRFQILGIGVASGEVHTAIRDVILEIFVKVQHYSFLNLGPYSYTYCNTSQE
jgi:hypothetical protein